MFLNVSSSPASSVSKLFLKTFNKNDNPDWETVMKEIGCLGCLRCVMNISILFLEIPKDVF